MGIEWNLQKQETARYEQLKGVTCVGRESVHVLEREMTTNIYIFIFVYLEKEIGINVS